MSRPSPPLRLLSGHHVHESIVLRAAACAARKTGLTKLLTRHTSRHSFASHLPEGRGDIRIVQGLPGHANMKTTMIYTHVLNRGPAAVRSPGDALRHHCGAFYADPHKRPVIETPARHNRLIDQWLWAMRHLFRGRTMRHLRWCLGCYRVNINNVGSRKANMTRHRRIEQPFEGALSVSMEEIEITLRGMGKAPWAEFLLNPRRLRGSDFLMRWSQGVWSEDRLTQAVNSAGKYFAMPYGPSGTAPDNDVRAFELYFERLEKAGLGNIKRPDLLVFRVADKVGVDSIVNQLNGPSELPFTAEEDGRMQELLAHAVMAVECENSLWRAKQMPNYSTPLTPQKRLDGRLGLKKGAVLPTIIIKEEDRNPLRTWQRHRRIPIHIWHAFFDEAYGISLLFCFRRNWTFPEWLLA